MENKVIKKQKDHSHMHHPQSPKLRDKARGKLLGIREDMTAVIVFFSDILELKYKRR